MNRSSLRAKQQIHRALILTIADSTTGQLHWDGLIQLDSLDAGVKSL
ncbi:hypothetical protein PI125_g15985 [Phytophthora idaei]|nr:hypothetical protein PI125_g15985 [Phytophthora idaei]